AKFRKALAGYNAIEVSDGHEAKAETDDALSLIQHLDHKTYLPGDINTKVDRASMAHSLEVRGTLLDHQLVDWVCRLPSNLKISGGETKRLLKAAAEPLLPQQLVQRSKMGFSVPLADWFRSDAGAAVASE